jgi:hypothetical protein
MTARGRWRRRHGELHLNGELLQDLHTRRGGSWSESPTAKRKGENRARAELTVAEGNWLVRGIGADSR